MASWQRVATACAVVVALALVPAPGQAGVTQPVNLGDGANVNVTLDGTGAADIVFTGRGANSKQLAFCRVPLGASACSPLTSINAPGDTVSLPIAFAAGTGSVVHVISYRYGLSGPSFAQDLMFTSNDGGATFDNGVPVGDVPAYDYMIGPGSAVSAVTSADQCGLCFQAFPTDGTAASAHALLSTDHGYYSAATLLDAQTPLVVFADAGGNAQFRRYGGSGDVNDAANWTPPVDIGSYDWPNLVNGPSGLFLVSANQLSGSTAQARHFDGTTFGTPVVIRTGSHPDDAAEDASGRIHVVGEDFSGTGRVVYSSSDDGTHWETEDVGFPQVPGAMRLAMEGDHFGVLVGAYQSGTPGVWFARIGPRAAVPATAKYVTATVVSGRVLVQEPGSTRFRNIGIGDVIPVGSLVDTNGGRVRIVIVLPGGKTATADFFEGLFKLTQAKNGVGTMVLAGGNFGACGRTSAVHSAKAKVIRHLWGSGSGPFRTKGRYAVAAVRGTQWDTIDRCDGTLVKVTQGRMLVTDLKTKKKITLKAGQSYLAKAKP